MIKGRSCYGEKAGTYFLKAGVPVNPSTFRKYEVVSCELILLRRSPAGQKVEIA